MTISVAKFLFRSPLKDRTSAITIANSSFGCSRFFLPIFLTIFLTHCGSHNPSKDNTGKPPTKIEREFNLAANKYGIPARFLLAVAHNESRFNPNPAIALYGNKASGPTSQQTAFGLSRKTLGLENNADADELSVQVDAYASWLSGKVSGLGLAKNPQTAEEKFSWLWAISQAQRQTQPPQRNLQALFAKELMDLLNSGFTLHGSEDENVVLFAKESPALAAKDFRQVSQDLLKLNTRKAQVFSATLFPLIYGSNSVKDAMPKGIEVIHCPFTLSACLGIISNEQATLPLQAHYVIPSDDRIVDSPLQLAFHETPLRTIRSDGVVETQNKVFIMLTGASGKIMDGIRSDANPMWVSKWQLQRLGELVSDICTRLSVDYRDNLPFKNNECSKVGKFVTFRAPASNGLIRWGEISDFDANIFASYIQSPTGLGGETSFAFTSNEHIFEAGSAIKFQLLFQPTVQQVVIEKLVRCPNHQVVWSAIAKEESRSQTKMQFEKSLWDAGPNGNGEHFFRAKVYEKSGNLLGWASSRVLLKHYEATQYSPDASECPTH